VPTKKLLDLGSELNEKVRKKIPRDIYNDKEDDLADDELIKEIKARKLREQILVTD